MGAPGPNARPGRRQRAVVYEPHVEVSKEVAEGTRPVHLYLRLSRYHKDGADAIERQRIDLQRQLAAEGGWTVMSEYIDNDSASASAARERKGWRLLNEHIQAGRVGALAFWKLDRTNRIASQTLEWLAMCRDKGVRLISHQDGAEELNSATAGAKLATGLKALFAEIETDTMSERQKAAKRHLAEAGFVHGSAPPFGWVIGERETDDLGRTGKRLKPHPVEYPALQDAVEMVTKGSSLTEVSRHWRDHYGITRADGRVMPAGNVRRVLMSPHMLGYRPVNTPKWKRGEPPVDLMRYVVRTPDGQPLRAHEAVCTRLEWERMMRAMRERSTAPRRQAWGKNEWLLTGMLYCPGCNRTLSGMLSRHRGKETLNYACMTNTRQQEKVCSGGVAIRKTRVEPFVLGWLEERLSPARVAQARSEERQRASGDDRLAEVDAVRSELTELRAQQGSDKFKGAMVGVLLTMIADAQERLDRLEGAQIEAPASDLPVGDGAELAERWGALPLGEKRRVLRLCIERIEIKRATPQTPIAERVVIVPRF